MVVQETLLFRAEMWVVTPCMARTLGVLYHWMVSWLMEKIPKRRLDGV